MPLTEILPIRDSKIRGAIVRMAKSNAMLKRLVNKLLPIKKTSITNQTGMAREQKLRREAAVIGRPKRKYEC